MYANYQKGPQGVQNDRYSGSKVTNLRRFQPFWSATEKIYSKYEKRIKNRTYPFIRVEPTTESFLFPVSLEDIRGAIESIPPKFVKGIKAILVPTGSKKQIKAANSLYIYGEYWQHCIFLHPYPKALMVLNNAKTLKPHELDGYKRSGAEISDIDNNIEVRLTESSLRTFYLNDVLMHEIGHHIDRVRRPQKERERFAEWFALEYGYRLQR